MFLYPQTTVVLRSYIYSAVGPGEDKKQMLLRSLVLSYGGTYGVMEDVIKEAQKMFDQDRISRNVSNSVRIHIVRN